ncbi:protein FRA10AC1 homolog [Dermacentor variabilis]|uniref:protein FRA10AC1 homolog n=1 Tax=Dermacentor variabilis TaxID=34621 RepID=UPI003F5AE8D1
MENHGRDADADSVVDFARHRGSNEYDSNFETDSESVVAGDERSRKDLLVAASPPRREPKAHRDVVVKEYSLEEKRRERNCFLALDAYTRHKKLINDYLLCYPGATSKLKRDTSRDRTDFDIIRENHQFLWDESDDEEPPTWEKQLAKRYYDKLFKEYCICDLTYYQANKIAMRWRTEQEVIAGKGQFSCGDRQCKEPSGLRTWEVNFAYFEKNEKKNALVKLRLCAECSFKLNYRFQRKELTKNVTKRSSSKHDGGSERKKGKMDQTEGEKAGGEPTVDEKEVAKDAEESIWSKPSTAEEEKSQEEEFDSYLADMFL